MLGSESIALPHPLEAGERTGGEVGDGCEQEGVEVKVHTTALVQESDPEHVAARRMVVCGDAFEHFAHVVGEKVLHVDRMPRKSGLLFQQSAKVEICGQRAEHVKLHRGGWVGGKCRGEAQRCRVRKTRT